MVQNSHLPAITKVGVDLAPEAGLAVDVVEVVRVGLAGELRFFMAGLVGLGLGLIERGLAVLVGEKLVVLVEVDLDLRERT